MQSPAIRNPHLARSSSPVRGSIVGSDPPTEQTGEVARKLTFGSSQTTSTRGKVGRPTNGTKTNGRTASIAEDEEDEEEEEDEQSEDEDDDDDEDEDAILSGRAGSQGANAGGDDSMQMVGGLGDDLGPISEEDSNVDESIIEAAVQASKTKQTRRPGRPKKVKAPEPEPEPEPESPLESESEAEPFQDDFPEADQEENEPPEPSSEPESAPEPEPEPAATRKKGRPRKDQSKSEVSIVQKKPGKRGRPPRNSMEQPAADPAPIEEEEDDEDLEARSSKRQRTSDKPAVASKPTKVTKAGRGRPKATPAVVRPSEEPSVAPGRTAKAKSKEPTPAPAPAKRPGRPRKSGSVLRRSSARLDTVNRRSRRGAGSPPANRAARAPIRSNFRLRSR